MYVCVSRLPPVDRGYIRISCLLALGLLAGESRSSMLHVSVKEAQVTITFEFQQKALSYPYDSNVCKIH